MRSSESTAGISEALVRFLADVKNPAKTKEGGGGQKRYKYAELPDILDQVREGLGTCLLTLTMECVTDGPTVGACARVIHTSGEWLEYGPLMLPAGNDAQSAGSALTYARRYLLCAILNIAADEDDDGAAAAKSERSRGTPPSAASEPESGHMEGASDSGNHSGEVGGEANGSDGTSLGTPASPEPHDHVWMPSPKPNMTKWDVCSVQDCLETRRRPSVHTAPKTPDEERKDLAS